VIHHHHHHLFHPLQRRLVDYFCVSFEFYYMAEHAERALIGAGVGTVVGLVLQPFDVVKTRQQRALLRGEPTVSLLAGFRRLVADGGGSPGGVVRSLWRGSVPTIARMGPGAAIYFSVVAAARKRGTAGESVTIVIRMYR
jgi:hypothetical protein